MRGKTILPVAVLLVGLLAVGASGRLGAQASSSSGQSYVGTWQVIQIVNGKTSGIRLATWYSDGTILTSGPVVTAAAPGSANKLVFNSTAHGVWRSTGPATAAATFSWLRSDENGKYLGMTTIQLTSTLAPDGQSFKNVATFTLTDSTGKVISTVAGGGGGTRVNLPDMGTPTGTPAA
jgi:hypothetical protein